MFARLRPAMKRPSALLLGVALSASLTLTACGGDDEQLSGFDAVTVSGPVGSAPEVDWKGRLKPEKAKAKVLEEGDGTPLAKGDVVRVEFTLANGWTHQVNYDTYDETTVSKLVRVGEEVEPMSVEELLTAEIVKAIKPGQHLGTRIGVTVGSEELIGDYLGNTQVSEFFAGIDVGNEDGLLFVADLVELAGPQGQAEKAPAWAPKIVEKDGVPAALDFKGVPKPTDKLRTALLIKGTGPVVESGQSILVNYLGQVYKGKKPFDESYTGTGFVATVGGEAATVVKGWSEGLVGVPVGSRVLLQIPPKLGYGNEAQGDIPANSTLYFVVDVLDAADPEPAPAPAPAEGSSE
ncbi:FKBP-type peptidyl-prolyl cis-trans isomerase [Nocardioides sp. zg-536]|uniref:peptidylprolyl isomerase n=1 Tax=Nocardioides faecalis TaxID=2803858 RepID=A0A938Y4F5_9ACTN|nr:FKBP-type peptidyl-prolyl cis-trans isomerase [Nocardioides faecalis]MBM9459065.1 FKBP-type peptidyl-prolyl cis-trans isomerase [Nocardioides faecalis]QVI57328.1 FKBP-type peptidyl-prolyl cis-trans isomerase [Nocardioides faecalis]